MTAPVIEKDEPPAVEVGPEVDGEMALIFPVLVLEAVETSDGRYLNAGSLTHRALPISLLACPESAHGGNDPDAAVVVGRIDTLTRTPGPDLVSKRTGEPFPEGSFVWSATGAMYSDVTVGKHNIGDLVRRRFLRGVSVDLAGMDVELIGEDEALADAEHPRRRMVAHSAEISAATLVPIPAFGDAYVEIAGEDFTPDPVSLDELPEGLAASAFPAWRSPEVGDPAPIVAAAGEAHTGGMIALLPVDPDALTVDGGGPADDMHLTLAYLGDDVTGWDDAQRAAVLDAVRAWSETAAPVEAEVMGHAAFNPTGAHDREPCAVYLVSGPGLAEAKTAMSEHDVSEHPIFLPHITAGYGLEPSALNYVGPVTFDRVRVALADEAVDYEIGEPSMTKDAVVADASSLRGRWNPADHPRDRRGRWIEKGGRVTLDDGTKGTVIDDDAGDGDVRVKADNGVQVRVRGSDIDVDDDGPTTPDRDNEPPTPAGGAAPADRVTQARSADELKRIVSDMDDAELREADKEMADRAAELGRPGAVSRGHKAVKDAIAERGGPPEPATPPPANPARKPRTDRGLTPPKADTSRPPRLPALPPDEAGPSPIAGSEAGRRAADRINISSAPRLAVKEISTADLHAADYEMRRRAIEIGGDPDRVSKSHKLIKAELKKRGETPIVASATFAQEFPEDLDDDTPDETGMPDAPQPCEASGTPDYESEVGEHPATRSLLYDGRQRYAATCDTHDEWTRGKIAELGFEVDDVVEIREPDRLDAEEQEVSSRTADRA